MDDVTEALRMGWAMAEARGRTWPDGPKPPTNAGLPPAPLHVLRLRSQRDSGDSRDDALGTLLSRADHLGVALADDRHGDVKPTVEGLTAGEQWDEVGRLLERWDGRIQEDLALEDEALANAYLLGRGLAECYWGLGPDDQWTVEKRQSGVSLGFLFGDDRRRELNRMLVRLKSPAVHELSASVISGTLEAWHAVAEDPQWSRHRSDVRDRLYEQARRWYQLLVLGQDPTTMIRPSDQLANGYYLRRTLRAFWLQGVLALVAIALTSTFFLGITQDIWDRVTPFLATGGVSVIAAAGLLTRGQSAAQRMLTRMRQDAYTDLVAVSVTAVPDHRTPDWRPRPPEGDRTASADQAWRAIDDRAKERTRQEVEQAVRKRRITPPTPPLDPVPVSSWVQALPAPVPPSAAPTGARASRRSGTPGL